MKVKFLINPSGKFNLSYNIGEIVEMESKQAELLLEAEAVELVVEEVIEKPKAKKNPLTLKPHWTRNNHVCCTQLHRISHAATDYISVADAKTHLRVTSSSDDTYIGGLIAMALDACGQYIGYSVRKGTAKYGLMDLPGNRP
jgi:hypothetical protein